MRSTGEVMGIADSFEVAFGKAMLAAGMRIPKQGTVFISVRDGDKPTACEVGRRLRDLGFSLVATAGTASALERAGVEVSRVKKVAEGSRHAVDMLEAGEIDMVINTTEGEKAIRDSYSIRRHTLLSGTAYYTTMAAAHAAVGAIEAEQGRPLAVTSLQEYHESLD